MVVFTKTHNLVAWLLPKSERFPKAYRSTLTHRLVTSSLEVLERLHEARMAVGRKKVDRLRAADASLAKVRAHILMIHHLRWLTDGQFAHVSRMVDEVGRLLGGWLRTLEG